MKHTGHAGKFPGSPVVKTLHFHCQTPGLDHKSHSTAKKENVWKKEIKSSVHKCPHMCKYFPKAVLHP